MIPGDLGSQRRAESGYGGRAVKQGTDSMSNPSEQRAVRGDARLPTFIVIGAAKCGTTSLATYLARHPEVFVTEPKEPGFFDDRNRRDIDWYRGLFASGNDLPSRGEASTTYTRFPTFDGVPARMHAIVPEVKLIYLIRDPFERIESHYLMRLRRGQTEGSLASVITRKSEYVEISQYGMQLSKYLEHFDRSQLLVMRLEDMAADATVAVRQALAFIGADLARGPERYDDRHNERPSGVQRRPFRAPQLLQPLIRRAPKLMKSTLKAHLTTPVADPELRIPDGLRADLRRVFEQDFRSLRAVVGRDVDLYGLA